MREELKAQHLRLENEKALEVAAQKLKKSRKSKDFLLILQLVDCVLKCICTAMKVFSSIWYF